jgi:hypothetical protein
MDIVVSRDKRKNLPNRDTNPMLTLKPVTSVAEILELL